MDECMYDTIKHLCPLYSNVCSQLDIYMDILWIHYVYITIRTWHRFTIDDKIVAWCDLPADTYILHATRVAADAVVDADDGDVRSIITFSFYVDVKERVRMRMMTYHQWMNE